MPLRLGGHSKGGNLAAWAAIHLPEKLQEKWLTEAYNNDGPGFSKAVLQSEEYRRVEEKIHTFIPESSIVGMLLEHAEDYTIIDSTNRSLMQHEPLSWNVLGKHFIYLGQRSEAAQLSDNVVSEWLEKMTIDERREFVTAIGDILSLGGKVKTLDDLRSGGLGSGLALMKEYIGADEKKKKVISEIMKRLATDMKAELQKAANHRLKTAEKSVQKVLQDLKK